MQFDLIAIQDRLYALDEIVDVLELAIDAGKSNVRDVVKFDQLFHDHFADLLAGDLAIGAVLLNVFDHNSNHSGDFGSRNGTLPTSSLNSTADFFRLKDFARVIFFDNANIKFRNTLVRRESLVA